MGNDSKVEQADNFSLTGNTEDAMSKLPKFTAVMVLFLFLAGCGGSGGGGSDDPETSTKCVLGTSTIGDCTI